MSYVFSFTCFFTAANFHLALVAASISHFVTGATKFSCYSFLPTKNVSFVFFSRWASLACRVLSLFLGLSLALYSKSVDTTINLSLILWTPRIQKQFPLSVFVFIDSLVVSPLQDAGGYVISRQNNLELHLGCHTSWLSYFTLVCPWCGRTFGRSLGPCTVTWLPNFLGWWGSARARFARAWSSAITWNKVHHAWSWDTIRSSSG